MQLEKTPNQLKNKSFEFFKQVVEAKREKIYSIKEKINNALIGAFAGAVLGSNAGYPGIVVASLFGSVLNVLLGYRVHSNKPLENTEPYTISPFVKMLFYTINNIFKTKNILLFFMALILTILMVQATGYWTKYQEETILEQKKNEALLQIKEKEQIELIKKVNEKEVAQILDFLNKQEELELRRLRTVFWEIKYVESKEDVKLASEAETIEKLKTKIKNHYFERSKTIQNVYRGVQADKITTFDKKTYDNNSSLEVFLNWQQLTKLNKVVTQAFVDEYLNSVAKYLTDKEGIGKYLYNNRELIEITSLI